MGWFITGIILTIIAVISVCFLIATMNNNLKKDYADKMSDYATALQRYGAYTGKKPEMQKISKGWILLGFLPLLLIVFGCFTSVQTGYTGVVTVFGKVKPTTLEAGFHFKSPFESVVQIDNRVQKQTLNLSCFSSDIQEVMVDYTINYQISKQNASEIYKTIGTEYYNTVMSPRIEEVVKNAVKAYTAETLVNNRSELAETILTNIKTDLLKYNIEVVSSSVENIDFSDAFTQAVENKQVASQKQQQTQIEQETLTKTQQEQNKREVAIAQAQAEIATIQAEADKSVAEINADSAEYQGRKDGAIILQYLISLNGYHLHEDGKTILNADNIVVSAKELEEASKNLVMYYYIKQWTGELPNTYIGTNNFYEMFAAIIANKT